MTLIMTLAAALAAGPELSVAYYGDTLVHPGASTRLSTWTGEEAKIGLEGQTGVYWHPKNQVAFHLRGGPAVRLEGPRGGIWGAFVHAGGVHGFWAAPTYAVVDGEVRNRALAGDTWFAVTPGLELGRDQWFVRPQTGLKLPTFHGHGIDVAVEVGFRFGGDR